MVTITATLLSPNTKVVRKALNKLIKLGFSVTMTSRDAYAQAETAARPNRRKTDTDHRTKDV